MAVDSAAFATIRRLIKHRVFAVLFFVCCAIRPNKSSQAYRVLSTQPSNALWGVPQEQRYWVHYLPADNLTNELSSKDLAMNLHAASRLFFAALACGIASAITAQENPKIDFPAVVKSTQAEKPKFADRQQKMLAERYDLSDRGSKDAKMSRGKPVQEGVRVKLPAGTTWDALAAKSPGEIKQGNLWPAGFFPLPHPHHEAGGMIFPKQQIDEVKKQNQRDLTRFDLDFDFDLHKHLLPEFPPPIFLTTRPDLGDVSKGQLVTLANFWELFKDALNPKQLEGLRLLLTPFPQQQFNGTDDRRSLQASQGVACFDCHANGHTNAATHTVGDIRPNEHRHRIDTPSLRGVNVQRLFGSQRALKSIEDFTEFEQRAAYFDGDPATAARKGINPLERGSQVHFMAEFQSLLDFPPRQSSTSSAGSIPPSPAKASAAVKPSFSERPSAPSATPRLITPTT